MKKRFFNLNSVVLTNDIREECSLLTFSQTRFKLGNMNLHLGSN